MRIVISLTLLGGLLLSVRSADASCELLGDLQRSGDDWDSALVGAILRRESVPFADKSGQLVVVEGGFCGESPQLLWVRNSEKGPLFEMPLAGKKAGWEFLDIGQIADVDGDGRTEILIVGTGGAGMYFHYPIVLRITLSGRLKVIFHQKPPLFYGDSEILRDPAHGLVIDIVAVDRERPWVFSDCSMCTHPFKKERFEIDGGVGRRIRREQIFSPLGLLSDFLLAAGRGKHARAFGYLIEGAQVDSVAVSDKETLTASPTWKGLTRTRGDLTCTETHLETAIGSTEKAGKKITVIEIERPDDFIRFSCLGDGAFSGAFEAEIDETLKRIRSIRIVGE